MAQCVALLLENERAAEADVSRSSAAFETTLIALSHADRAGADAQATIVATIAGRSLAQQAVLAGQRAAKVKAQRRAHQVGAFEITAPVDGVPGGMGWLRT